MIIHRCDTCDTVTNEMFSLVLCYPGQHILLDYTGDARPIKRELCEGCATNLARMLHAELAPKKKR